MMGSLALKAVVAPEWPWTIQATSHGNGVLLRMHKARSVPQTTPVLWNAVEAQALGEKASI